MKELLINYAKELHINLNEDKVKKFLKNEPYSYY